MGSRISSFQDGGVELSVLTSLEIAKRVREIGLAYHRYEMAIIDNNVNGLALSNMDEDALNDCFNDIGVTSKSQRTIIITYFTSQFKLNTTKIDERTSSSISVSPNIISSGNNNNGISISNSTSNNECKEHNDESSNDVEVGSKRKNAIVSKESKKHLNDEDAAIIIQDFYKQRSAVIERNLKFNTLFLLPAIELEKMAMALPNADKKSREIRRGLPNFGTAIYDGELMDEQMLGLAEVTLSNGSIFRGLWRTETLEAKGVYTQPDGSVYEGGLNRCLMEGQGELRYPNGDVFHGNFKSNMKQGKGVMAYFCGDVYEGEFCNNKIQGQGVMTLYNSHFVYEGEFYDGKLSGHGVKKTTKGAIIHSGIWLDGKYLGE